MTVCCIVAGRPLAQPSYWSGQSDFVSVRLKPDRAADSSLCVDLAASTVGGYKLTVLTPVVGEVIRIGQCQQER